MSCVIQPGISKPRALRVAIMKFRWNINIHNKILGGDGCPSSFWDLNIPSTDDPTWITAGIVLHPPHNKIPSGSATLQNGGVYGNGNVWGRSIVAYALPYSSIRLVVFFGVLGDINNCTLQPVSRVKFIDNGGMNDTTVKLMCSDNNMNEDTVILSINGTQHKIKATTTSPVQAFDGSFDVMFIVERA